MRLGKSFVAASTILISTGLPSGVSAAGPAVTINPASLTFGTANPSGPYPTQSAAIVNSGVGPLILSNITVENPLPGSGADFTQTNNCYPFPRTLPPGQSCTVQVGFFPGAYGVRQGAILIASNAPGSQDRLPLVGYAYPFKAIYTLDGFGGLHPANAVSPGMAGTPYWPGWKIARAAAMLADGSGGYTLDGFGGLHQFGTAPVATGGPNWNGWDIARDVVLLPGSTVSHAGGYVLDGFGGLHQFGGAPVASGAAYWSGRDIAKRVKLLPDGSGGYVLDGFGALHPFAVGSNPLPHSIADNAYWPGWNIARDFDLFSNSTAATAAGYTLDGFGGAHAFGFTQGAPYSASYWPNFDIARSIRLDPTSTTSTPFGWTMEGCGGIHALNGAQYLPTGSYWGADIAIELVVVR
jgi:hypothetical protein